VLGIAEQNDFQPIQPMGNQPAANPLIPIDPRARGALQKQIYAGIRRAILEGALRPGTRLMSSRALAADLGVSRITTLLALEQLQAEGYVTARRGSGMFVAHELPDDLPQLPIPISKALATHPPLSRRGAELAATPPASRRLPGPPRAFRLGAPAVDLFPRVEKDVTHWLLEECEFGLGDDVWCRPVSGIDMIVAHATTPRKDDFTVRRNGAFGGGRLDEIRMARPRH